MTTNLILTQGARVLLTTGLISTLIACGGGSGGSDQDSVSTEVLTQGAIQRFGSVYVGDIEYMRSATSRVITDDNPSANEDSLRMGMRVKLRGRYNDDGTGIYDSIEVDNELKGQIETGSLNIPDPLNSPNVGSFKVLGTTVLVAEGVFFDESGAGNTVNSLLDLEDDPGLEDVVEVSGLFNENGDLEALRIEKKADDLVTYLAAKRKLEVKGTVASVDTLNMQFTYDSGLVVDYTNAKKDDDLPNDPDNWVDLYMESKCDPRSTNFGGDCFNGTILLATKVDNETPEMDDSREAELEGIITDFNGLDDFKVSRYPVDATDADLFCGNASLGNGLKVKVRGNVIKINDVNTVNASIVECRQAKSVRLQGEVENNGNGTITLLGIEVFTNDKTELDDLGPNEPGVGDAVKVRGFVDGDGKVIAVRVEGEDSIDFDDFVVQAPKDQVTDIIQGSDTFTLLGVVIDTSLLDSGSPDSDFEGLDDENITRETFYQALLDGTASGVKAKGSYDSVTNTLTAREVELEDND